ncbi:MAG: hypothetical protein OSB67_10750 [Alphaproteobacteria bacterium]|nr:hypothetical protein [Alphaproteobacteria bacterium]
MKILGLAHVGILLVVLAVMTWQHLRYVNKRRAVLQDHQPLLYSGEAFHALTFLRLEPGQDLLEAVRAFRDETQNLGGAQWVYAGKSIVTPNHSSQIGPIDWSAVTLVQYPSRDAYDEVAASERYRGALVGFAQTYTLGFKRPVGLNLGVHQFLLAKRARQIMTFAPSLFPFERDEALTANPEAKIGVERLLAEKEFGAQCVVIVNLVKQGNTQEQTSNGAYDNRMMDGMAEGGYGPMHIGKAVRVESDFDFDEVTLVYYPGVEFFADMARSTFFQGIIGGKTLNDTQTSLTVPILERL